MSQGDVEKNNNDVFVLEDSGCVQDSSQQRQDLSNDDDDDDSASDSFQRRRRNRANSNASSTASSIPSIQTASFHWHRNNNDDSTAATEAAATAAAQESSVSADQERQILLLMLLAQVCALHDATPRTFTVHVLELFERGILDRESIHFLFDLGLVPSTSSARGLLTEGGGEETTTSSGSSSSTQQQLAITTTSKIPKRPSEEEERSQEASAIRFRLKQHHEQREPSSHPASQSNINNNNNNKHWDVEHFPLSLSRYQREFTQVALLNAGAFGQVFRATRKMDGCDYAIKKVPFDATGYSNEAIQQVVREVQCLATVSDHPNIVRYHTSWLEPSWMTGSGQIESNIPQHKLLTDLQQLMQPGDDDNEDEAGENVKTGSSYFTRDPSSTSFGQRRRRFSFGSSVDAMDQSWEEYHSQSLGDLGFAYDDSYLVSRKKPHPKPPHSPTYRYQICLYIQMQLCHPATLADWIRERNRQIPEAEHARRIGPALDIFQQIVSGLAHVHAKGIIHRDLKPANIFASSDGQVIKIGDFGLSKQLLGVKSSTTPKNQQQDTTPTSNTATRTEYSHTQECWHQAKANDGALIQIHKTKIQTLVEYGKTTVDPLTAGIGTASYASPEQVKSRTYGTAADIFSVGLILLELLSCFETEHERLHNFQQCRNQRLPPWIHKIYPDIAAIILACTRADSNQRPTAKDLLERILARAPGGDKTRHKDVHILKGQLVEKEEELEKQKNELAEKDRIIENLRLEMERMKATLLLTNEPTATQLQEAEVQVESVVVEEATSFGEDN